MPRTLTREVAEQFNADHLRVVVFVEMLFRSGYLRLWSGLGNIDWNGQTWTGYGVLGSISTISESVDIRADGTQLTLSGIPQDMLSKAINECVQGNPVRIYFGALDEGENVIAVPFMIFSGRMDVPTVDEGEDTSTITLTAENRLIDLQRARERRYTDQDQQIDFPGDRGFEFVPMVQEWNGIWGKAGGSSGGGSGHGNIGPPSYKPNRWDR